MTRTDLSDARVEMQKEVGLNVEAPIRVRADRAGRRTARDQDAARLEVGDTDGFLFSLREALHVETHESKDEIVLMAGVHPG